jgi:hypothetical protein
MKKNYSAWNISYDDFFAEPSLLGKLNFLLRFGILAPSTHNSQPWKFAITENAIVISPDFSRSLSVSDPSFRHLYISLGCVLENIMVAADYYGLHPQVSYEAQNHASKDAKKMMSITITFSDAVPPKPIASPQRHLISAILARRSNRNAYISHAIPLNVIEEIKRVSDNGAYATTISDETKKTKIAEVLMESRVKAFSYPAFRKEMAGYKRHNFTKSFTGMPGFTMGMDPTTSLFAGFLIRNFNVMKWIRGSETDLLKKYTPTFVIISSDHQTPEAWIQSGRTLERVLLTAQYHNIQTSLSALPPDIAPLQKIIGIASTPQMFVRMGYTNEIPGHSPRLLVDASKS